MVLSIGFHRVLRSQTISKGQPAQEPLVSQILWKIRKTPQAPEDRSCPNRILKNKGKNAWNWLRFLRTIMRKRTKGRFQNVLLRWLQPLIPPFAAPVHVHAYTHTQTNTHTHIFRPSIRPGGWDSVTGEAGQWLSWRSWVHWTFCRGCGGLPQEAVWAEVTVLPFAK